MSEGTPRQPGPDNLPRFLAHLEGPDRGAADLARRLLEGDWRVESFWGPEQMDVWELVLSRGPWRVRFGIERGYADGVTTWREEQDGTRGTVYCRLSEERFADLIDDLSTGRII